MMTERGFAQEVVRKLRDAGYEAYWAGGCVRDELLGLDPADYDVATNARPGEVRALFRNTIEVGAAFGVIDVIGPRRPDHGHIIVQVATFRVDGNYTDGRRPDTVSFCSAEEDARRRDFTINGMFFDPMESHVIDYVGGRADLAAKILRAIGDPRERFREDKLRMLRAVRMATRFDLQMDPETVAGIHEMADQIRVVSAERIAEELRKILVHPDRARGMQLMNEMGLLRPILPELVEGNHHPQRGDSRPLETWEHTLRVLRVLEGPTWPERIPVSFPLAFAVLFHDRGRDITRQVGRNLKLSNEERQRIEFLVEHHRHLIDAMAMKASRLKPLLVHPGIGELLALHRALAFASDIAPIYVGFCERMLRETPALALNPPPIITGDDLTRHGMSPGPSFKHILDAVRAAQLDAEITNFDEAMQLVNHLRNHSFKHSS